MNTEDEINGELILVTPGGKALPGHERMRGLFLGEDAILVLGINKHLTFRIDQ